MAVAQPSPDEENYKLLEHVLSHINREVIALEDLDVKRNNILLSVITNKIIATMKQKDDLFKVLYKNNYYGGSYYDNLKVGEPNEYDLDLILCLPLVLGPYVTCSDKPGFVRVRLKNHTSKALEDRFEHLKDFLDNPNFLSTKKVMAWFEGVFSKALKELKDPLSGRCRMEVILDRKKPNETITVDLKVNKGIPAFTLNVTGNFKEGSEIKMDIDLVPCFEFDERHWPPEEGGYRPNPSSKKSTFLVVPKRPKEKHFAASKTVERYWRLSFQEQEREIIGRRLKRLKPSLRLLKKLRDKFNHNIASYFIKTIYLWTVDEIEESFWSKPLSFVFITMLKKYEQCVRNNCIPYYWNAQYNLIECLRKDNNETIANTLKNIINDIEKGLMVHPVDFNVVGKNLLTNEEYETLKNTLPLTKKQKNHICKVHFNYRCKTGFSSVDSGQSPLRCLGYDSDSEREVQANLNRWSRNS